MKYLLHTAATLALACSSTSLEVGSYSFVNGNDPGGWTSEESCAFGPQLPIVGRWTGTRTELTPSGSDFVELVISSANTSRVCGTLTFGRVGPAWPPVTDRDVGYPPELADNPQSFEAYVAGLEGTPRTMTLGHVAMPRISFRASYAQWRKWCSMQTPYQCEGVPMAEYYCVPTSGSGGLTPRVRQKPGIGCFTDYRGETHVVDCGKAMLCLGGPCTCTSTHCTAPPFWGSDYELFFGENSAVGSGMALTRAR